MKQAMTILFLAAAATLLGCEDKPAGPAPASTTAAATVKEDELITKTDFEDEAEKSITGSNYKQELDSLEKEVESGQ